MANKAKLQSKKKKKSSSRSEKSADSPLSPQPHPELVFGLIGPAGTDLKLVFEALTKALNDVGYKVPKEEIRLSRLIENFLGVNHASRPEDERIEALMNEGTKLREDSGRGDAIALLAVAEIKRIREQEFEGDARKKAYILHSLKHPHEVETLRNIYGKGFYAISVYSPRDDRVALLSKRIAKSRASESSFARSHAERLIEKDEEEVGKVLGQDVKDAFPKADLFLDARVKDVLEANVKRFIELIFGNWSHTPSPDEYAMYHAKSAAVRSADLGRQVGATISKNSDVIAVGCNDVPKVGGGLYWSGDEPDGRDFQLGYDASYEQREQMVAEILGRLCDHGWLEDKYRGRVKELVQGADKKILKNTQLFSLLEFGRSVHAEMAAITDAARRGVAVKGGTMHVTTFPCHLCAKHIVAAGIDRVVYIEPYPKSKAKELYADSIVVDATKPTTGRVMFEAYFGVAPRQYLELFQADGVDRKDPSGKVLAWTKQVAKPRISRFMNTYLEIEIKIVAVELEMMAKKLNVNHSLFSSQGERSK